MSTKSYYNKYWNKNHGNKDGHAFNVPDWPEEELHQFYTAIKSYVGSYILDIGAGEGYFISYLKKQTPKLKIIKALEISKTAINNGLKRDPSIDYFHGSADDKLPYKDEEFDTLFMTDVIEHLVDIDNTLSEGKRILKKKGKMIIITPDYNWLKKLVIAAFFWEKIFYPTNPHIRFFTKKSMDKIMNDYGFERIYYKWGLNWFHLMPQNSYYVYEKIK